MTFKQADSKGRISLGSEFADATVIIDRLADGTVVIKKAKVIPEVDAWLYDNPKALASVRSGLKQARDGKFAKKPPVLSPVEGGED